MGGAVRRAVLIDAARRRYAKVLIDQAPPGSVVTVTDGPNRTKEQNARMWAMIDDIRARWAEGGEMRSKDDAKIILMHEAGWDVEFLTGLDGKPFPIGFRSSNLTIKQMGEFMEWMQAYGDGIGVVWKEKERLDPCEASRSG